jgi:hypothetical protein
MPFVVGYLTATLQHQTLVQGETVSSRDTDISRQVVVNLWPHELFITGEVHFRVFEIQQRPKLHNVGIQSCYYTGLYFYAVWWLFQTSKINWLLQICVHFFFIYWIPILNSDLRVNIFLSTGMMTHVDGTSNSLQSRYSLFRTALWRAQNDSNLYTVEY